MENSTFEHFRAAKDRIVAGAMIAALACAAAFSASVENPTSEQGVAATASSSQPISYDRQLVAKKMADPGIIKLDDGSYLLSGTANGRPFPLYESSDLKNFELIGKYNPDPFSLNYDYCDLWAPDLTEVSGKLNIDFSAERVKKGEHCGGGVVPETVFHASSPAGSLSFGQPQPFEEKTGMPHTSPDRYCVADCEDAMQSDSAVFYDNDGKQWIFYVWMQDKKHYISGFQPDSDKYMLAVAPTDGEEYNIVEAPFVFTRDGRYYLVYSTGSYQKHYALNYLMADSVEGLTREGNTVHSLSAPVERANGKMIENAGHAAVTEKDGQYYLFYHIGKFNKAGKYKGRDTYMQPLAFNPDGTIDSINELTLDLPNDLTLGSNQSIDIKTKNGEWIKHCFGPKNIRDKTSVEFTGACPSDDYKRIEKADITAVRLNSSRITGKLVSATVFYDGHSDELTLSDTDSLLSVAGR